MEKEVGFISKPKPVASTTTVEVSQHSQSQESFFPWINNREGGVRFNKLSFPWEGIIGLLGSCLTILCSWALLFSVRDTRQWQDKWPQVAKVFTPAAILSAIISLNGIFLHMAFTRGIAVAWWIRANNSGATVGTLHETWLQSSVIAAVKSGRRFNYVALATIFIALIPINGVLLQGALGVQEVPVVMPSQGVRLPFSKDFVSGFSGHLNQDGDYNGIGTLFSSYAYRYFSRQNRAQIVIETNVTNTTNQNPAYIYSLTSYPTLCQGTCSFEALGVGLRMECPQAITERHYDFSVNESSWFWWNYPPVREGLPIYSISFDWNVSRPNVIEFNLLSKTDYACSGVYKELKCTLTAATTKYKALIQNNQTISVGQSATLLSLQKDSEYQNGDVVAAIPPDDEVKSRDTKFGYLAKIFNDVYGSNITLQYSNRSGNAQYGLSQRGIYANAPWTVWGPDGAGDATYDYTLDIESKGVEGCQTWIQDVKDPLEWDRDIIFGNINRFMFYLAYRTGNNRAESVNDLSTFSPDVDIVWQSWYYVAWYHWFASLGATLLIVLCVLPTFWGFWNLTRKPDMSPVETARAFYSPVVADQNPTLPTEEILGHIHGRNIHDVGRHSHAF